MAKDNLNFEKFRKYQFSVKCQYSYQNMRQES